MVSTWSVLTLNLHGYQEERAMEKLAAVARAIVELAPDVVALQECVQDRHAAVVDDGEVPLRADNQALLLTRALAEAGRPHHCFWDWAHYGWDRWEEGCAILTPHPLLRTESRYVSKNTTTEFWKSRKPVAAIVEVPQLGPLAVFSVHLGWWDDELEPLAPMVDRLMDWEREFAPRRPRLVVGDFNLAAGTDGYRRLLQTTAWTDGYAAVHPDGLLDPTIGADTEGWATGTGERIDYTFSAGAGTPIASMRLFTENDAWSRVSDHLGVLTTYQT